MLGGHHVNKVVSFVVLTQISCHSCQLVQKEIFYFCCSSNINLNLPTIETVLFMSSSQNLRTFHKLKFTWMPEGGDLFQFLYNLRTAVFYFTAVG